MRPDSVLAKLVREVEAQRRSVLSEALSRLRSAGREERIAVASAVLRAAGFTRVVPIAECLGMPACGAEFPVGASRLRAIASVRLGAGALSEEDIATFRAAIADRAALGVIVSTARVRREFLDEAAAGSPPICVFDAEAIADALEEAGTLVSSVPVEPLLRLEKAARPAPAPVRKRSEADGRGRAPRLFRWIHQSGEGRAFVLIGEYLPDASLSFRVAGELVPPDEDFAAERTRLHQAICAELRRIFPDLPESQIRTKAWPGVHKVYPARQYGGAPSES